METSSRGLSLIEGQEAYRGYPYPDVAGNITWGYGHKRVGDEPIPRYISQPDAVALMRRDILPIETSINTNVKVRLTQNQFDALVDFTFNVGIEAFETSTLLKMLNNGDYTGAANQFLRWDHANENGIEVVVPDLYARRRQESILFTQPDVT